MEMKSYCFSLLVEKTLKTIILVGNLTEKQKREYLTFLQDNHYSEPNLEKLTERFFNINNQNQEKFSYIINENISNEEIVKFILDSIYNQNFKFINDMLRNVCDEAYFVYDGYFETKSEKTNILSEANYSFVCTRIFNNKEKIYDYKYFFQFLSNEASISTFVKGSMSEENINLGIDDDIIEFKDISTSEKKFIPTRHYILLFDILKNLKHLNNHLQLSHLIKKNTYE